MRKSFKTILYIFIGIIIVSVSYLAFILYRVNHAWADTNNKQANVSDVENSLPIIFERNDNQELYIDGVVLDDGSPRLNILILGNGGPNHPGAMLTDSIQIFSYNRVTEKASLISLPRDLYTDIDSYGRHKINEGLQIGLARGIGGDAMKNTVSKVLGIPIHKYFNINFYGFKDLINSIGGIDVNVSSAITDTELGNEFSVNAGMQHMDGDLALKYARSRKTTSDFDRSRRQQEIMAAAKKKMVDWKIFLDPSKIQSFFTNINQNIKTDLEISDIFSVLQKVESLDFDSVERVVIDNNPTNHLLYSTSAYGAYVLLPYGGNFKQVREYIQKYLP